MVKTLEFEVNDAVLRDMAAQGKSILHKAKIFENTFGAITARLRKGQQIEDYLTAELYQAYSLIQTHNKAHDPEAGKRFADEVKKWQAAKIRVPYRDGLFPFLDTTETIAARINEIHAWFD